MIDSTLPSMVVKIIEDRCRSELVQNWYLRISGSDHDIPLEPSHTFLSLPVRPPIANLLKPLQTQRPEVEVRIAKAF